MDSAHSHLAKVTEQNRVAREKAAQQARIEQHAAGVAAGRVLPDLNPADRAVVRMQQHAVHMEQFRALRPVPREPELLDRVARLENTLQLVLDSLNGATIECNEEDSTITLTFPDLPS